MANAASKPASERNANASRMAALRSRGSDQDRRRAWTRPFRRARRAIKFSFALMTCACRAIQAVEKFAMECPGRAARHLGIASDLMTEADEQLDCAARGRVGPTAELTAFSERLEKMSDWLIDSVQSGAIEFPVREHMADASEPASPFRLIPPPLLPPEWFSYERNDAPCIPVRRRSVRLTVVEAARRITRGRAPPIVSTCSP